MMLWALSLQQCIALYMVTVIMICVLCLDCYHLACSDDDYNQALTDGAFSKLLQVQLVRKIEGEQFFSVSF